MRIELNTTTRIVLISLVLLTVISLVITLPPVNDSQELHPLAISLMLCSLLYYRYLIARKLKSKGTKTFALQSVKHRNILNITNVISLLALSAVFLYTYFTSKEISKLIFSLGVGSAAITNWFYPNFKSIMIDNKAIYAKGLGKKLFKTIKTYSIDKESERILFVFKNDEKYSIAFNKYTDIKSLENELEKRINYNA